ncbi:MAG: endonuclease/exonuclease/phosphatase family protein, partial [Leptolyngbya sp. SIO3F4]|nr:endonuclease/exonuclease/phosphatase family protein [Leptolyngbya sp. SIO3F4]
MQVAAANLWTLNPRQLKAIHQCLQYEPDVVVLPELKRSQTANAEKLLADQGYTLIHTPVHRSMSLGIASRIPTTSSEVINLEPFVGRPQIKLQARL